MGVVVRLSGPQRLQFARAIVQICPSSADFTTQLLLVNKAWGALAIAGLTYEQNVIHIVGAAATEGWLTEFIQNLLDTAPDPDLQSLYDELKPSTSTTIEPFQACRLAGGHVMVDRADLRQSLRELRDDRGKRILIVKGGRKTGKTHTHQLISYEEQIHGRFTVVYLDLEPLSRRDVFPVIDVSGTTPIEIVTSDDHGFVTGMRVRIDGIKGATAANGEWTIDVDTKAGVARSFSLRGSSGHGAYAGGGEARQADVPVDAWDVAKRLVKLMKYDINLSARPTRGQWSRWVLEFCDDFEVHAKAEREQRWIVMDGFGSVVLTQSALDLVKELTNRLNQSLYLLRLVLLGFVETLPGSILGYVEEEEIKAIEQEDLLQFFARAFKEMGLPSDDEKLLEAAERVLTRVDPSASDYLMKLEPLANSELARAARGGP